MCFSSLGVINIDAHLDVRLKKENKVHSGSPFRLLLEDGNIFCSFLVFVRYSCFSGLERFQRRGGRFHEFAVQGSQCSAAHWDYVVSHPHIQTRVVTLREIRQSSVAERFAQSLNELGECGNIFVSFDLDSVCSADAPV